MNKKADFSIKRIIIIMLILVSFFLIFYFFILVGKEYNRAADETTCRASILAAAHAPKWDVSSIKCPTKYIIFDDESTEKVKKEMAEAMASCWNRFGEGKLLLFKHEPGFGTDKDEITFCNICEVYEFKNIPAFTGFGDYLSKNDVPVRYSQAPQKYIDYLSGRKMEDAVLTLFQTKLAPQQVDTSRSYAVIFTYTKDPHILSKKYLMQQAFESGTPFGQIFYGGPALALGKEVGADWNAQVALIPYDKAEVHRLCQSLEE